MIRAIIIDDEKHARELVKAFLKPHNDIQIVAECENGFEGIKKIQELCPDLIFLDIQMPKLSGFEMLELLDNVPTMIFSTAFDEFAVKAFENNAVDYLLKPYSSKRFDQALDKAKTRIKNNIKADAEVAREYRTESNDIIDRIAIRNGANITILPVHDISYIEAQDDYVAIITCDDKKYLKQLTMKFLEGSLPPDKFVRVHRSYIINIGQIERLESMTKDSYLAILKSKHQVSVSRTGYNKLKEVLDL